VPPRKAIGRAWVGATREGSPPPTKEPRDITSGNFLTVRMPNPAF
jgi:hypothetical protein